MTTAPDSPDLFDDGDERDLEDLGSSGTHLLDVVAAVDFLSRGDRHGFTVWDAIEEAVRWWVAERISVIDGVPEPDYVDLAWDDPDALRTALDRLLLTTGIGDDPVHISVALQQALRRWGHTMSAIYNDGAPWPPPDRRHGFPPPELPPRPDDSTM